MKHLYFTPGPSQLYPGVNEWIKQAVDSQLLSLSHRSVQFQTLFEQAVDSLRELLELPSSVHVFFLGSATEGMERLLQSCVSTHSFHFINGSFSKRFFTIAQQLGKQPQQKTVELGCGVDLSVDVPDEVEMICCTHSETSSGVMTPLEEIYALKQKYPDKLIAVDVVSSLPYGQLDFTKIDAVLCSVQKGLGLPSGLGFVMVNDHCLAKAKELEANGKNIGSFHSLLSLKKMADKHYTVETPNILDLFLMGKVCEEMNKKGREAIEQETEEKAKLFYDFFENHREYSLFVKEKKHQSPTVVVVTIPSGSAPIIEHLKEKGFVVGTGYGKMKDKQIRIGNFPAISLDDTKQLIEAFSSMKQ